MIMIISRTTIAIHCFRSTTHTEHGKHHH